LREKHKQAEKLAREHLLCAANPGLIKQALLRLIVNHGLPLRTVEWPELHTLIYAINNQADNVAWHHHQTTARYVEKTFEARQLELKQSLQGAQSLVHLTTDTWHSPNLKELQAITAHYVDSEGVLRKALLGILEMEDGHSGSEVAQQVIKKLDNYGIKERLGYITTDNHGANDTLCVALSEQLEGWQPLQRRLRCLGHIINLAVQS